MVQYFTDNTAHVATPTHIMSMGALPHIIIILGILSPPCSAVLLAPATATATSADFVVKVKVLDNAPSGAPVRTAPATFARSTSPLLSASTLHHLAIHFHHIACLGRLILPQREREREREKERERERERSSQT
jgi:hypothetical protein